MKLFKSLLLSVLFVAALSFTGCNEEPTTSVTPDNTTSLSKLTLPAGAVITSATFNIFVEDAFNHDITTHQVNVPWAEATETWNIFFAKTAPQFEAASLGGFNAGTFGWKTVDITTLVQAWVDGTTANNGVLLNQPVVGGWLNNYRSKEYGDGSFAPYLEVTYTVGGGAPITAPVEPAFGDTYISTISPDTPFGSETLLLNGRPLVDYIKYVLVQFDVDQQVMNCETAYAFGDTPFCGLPNIGNWGWTEYINGDYTNTNIPIYAGAAQCDPTKGTQVGTLSITYVGTSLTVNYTMNPGVTVENVHMWIGATKLPVKNGKLTSAPGQFNYNNQTFPFSLTKSNPFYIAVHFDACWGVDPN